jgi:uncharacterized protein involved in response to NO
MPIIDIVPPSKKIPPGRWVPFALGFRPFFLLAGLYAAMGLSHWVMKFIRGVMGGNYYGAIGWHSHEMLFGYAGIDTPRGTPLALLAGLWLASRLLAWWPAVPGWLLAPVDLAFLPLFAVAVAYPVMRAKHWKSLVFPALILAMAGGNLLVHLEALDIAGATARAGILLALYMVLAIMVVMGGRVIPFFTEKGVPGASPVTRPWLEHIVTPLVVLLGLALAVEAPSAVTGLLALLAGVAHGLRLAGWYAATVWRYPMIWVLQLGYAWIVAGFLLQAAASQGLISPFIALHALTAGGIGMLTLGMMARVTLGHTARNVNEPAGLVVVAFILLAAAVPVRVILPWLFPAQTIWWLGIFTTTDTQVCRVHRLLVSEHPPRLRVSLDDEKGKGGRSVLPAQPSLPYACKIALSSAARYRYPLHRAV